MITRKQIKLVEKLAYSHAAVTASQDATNIAYHVKKTLKAYEESKRTLFNPSDASSYPKPFTWVKTNLGIGSHLYLTDTKDSEERTYDRWQFIFNNKDEPTLFIGYGTSNPDIEVEWWQEI